MTFSAPTRRAAMRALALTLCLATANCRTTASGATDGAAFCDVAAPFRWSARDTRQTQEQAASHNAVGKALCGWK